MRAPKNIIRHEFIGLECEVLDSLNASQKGIKGKIINETLKTIVIRTEKNDKIIPKQNKKFRIIINNKKVDVDGNFLLARPEDRIKKKISRW